MSERIINKTTRQIYDAKSELTRLRNNFTNELNRSSSWWSGDAQKSFMDNFRDVDAQINRLHQHMSNIESRLRNLANDVRRAEEKKRLESLSQMNNKRF